MSEHFDLTEILNDCPRGAKLLDLSNQRFGKWTVLHRFDNPNKHDKRTLWTCRCECGNIRNIDSYTLRSGSSKSCGCSKDGRSKTRLYSIWIGIKDRTSCKDRPRAKDYIGRGITMCEEWKSWDSFKTWAINNGYNDTLSIDRIDNNKGYSIGNIRFVTMYIQNRNRRTNRKCVGISPNGEIYYFKVISDFAKQHDLCNSCITMCLKRKQDKHKGWTFYYADNYANEFIIGNNSNN